MQNILSKEKEIQNSKSCYTQLEKNFNETKFQLDTFKELNSKLQDKNMELEVLLKEIFASKILIYFIHL